MSILSWDDMDETTEARPISIPAVNSQPTGGLVDALLSDRDEPEIQLNAPVAKKEDTEQESVAAAKLDQIMLDPLAMLSERFTDPKEVAALEYLRSMDLMNGAIDTQGEPIQARHKSIIRGASDVNQLIPFKYEWAWTKYIDGSANHWMPQEVQMQRDIAQWKAEIGSPAGLTEDERMIVMRALGFFATADSVVMNNLVIAVYEWITSPEHRQYIATQIKEESIHQHAYQYCIESLQMDQQFVFNMYRKVPSMTLKSAWCIKYTYSTKREDYVTDDDYDRAQIKNLISQYVVMEGIFFYCGFASVLSMGRRNKLPGVCEQFQYILRDESMHLNFGVDTINQIRIEFPHLFDAKLFSEIEQMIIGGTLLEIAFAYDTTPKGVLGYNAEGMEAYLKYICNRRLEQLGIKPHFEEKPHPFSWMSEMMDLRKEKNFFETRVTDYQTGGALTF